MALNTERLFLACLGLSLLAIGACDSNPQGVTESGPDRTIALSCAPIQPLVAELLADQGAPNGKAWALSTAAELDAPGATEAIGGRSPRLLCPAGADPTHWAPTREALSTARSAELLISIGSDFEPWVANANLAPSRHLELLDGTTVERPEITVVSHRHGDGPAHSHAGRSPFAWLDPVCCAEITAWLGEELTERYPNFDSLEHSRRIGEVYRMLDQRAKELFERCKDVRLLAPSSGEAAYWSQRYGVRIDPFDLPEGSGDLQEGLGPWENEDLAAIRGRLDPARANLVFVAREVSGAGRTQLLEQLDLRVVNLDNGIGLAADSQHAHWSQRLASNFDQLEAALTQLGR